jgi:DNA end-binding protein Ku
MARAIWKGVVSFGLVSIPVEVHTAVRDHRPHFRLLHAKDTSPIKFSRVCEHEGKPVAWDELVKGYEYSKDEFVVLTKADFEAAAVEKTKRVDILDFVDADEVDDRYFETPYYLAPGKGGEHAYALLREAMRDANRIGIAKFVLRDTMHLCAVEVIDDALVLTLMRFADELVDTAPLNLPAKKEIRKAELDMAKALINTLAAEWTPEKYADDYRDNLMRIIKAKAKGKTVRLPEGEGAPAPTKVVDLMERLRQSLDAAKRQPGGTKTRARASKPRVAAARRVAQKKTKRVA